MGLLLIKKLIYILGVVEAVIDEELEFWDDTQLVARALSQLIANLADVGVDVVADFLCTFAGEDAQVAAADAHVGADAAGGDGDDDTASGLCLALEDVAELFLYKACDFILTSCFHFKVKSEK